MKVGLRAYTLFYWKREMHCIFIYVYIYLYIYGLVCVVCLYAHEHIYAYVYMVIRQNAYASIVYPITMNIHTPIFEKRLCDTKNYMLSF